MYHKFVVGLVVLSLVVGVFGEAMSEGDYQALFTEWTQKHGKSYSAGEFQRKYETFRSNHQTVANFNARSSSFKMGLNKFSDLSAAEFSTTHLGAVRPVRPNTTDPTESLPAEEGRKRTCATGSAMCGTSCCSTASNYGCVSGQCRYCAVGNTFCGNGCCPSGYSCAGGRQCALCGSAGADATGCAGSQTATSSPVAPAVNWTASGYVTPVKDQGQCGSCWSFATTGTLEAAWNKKYALTGTRRVVLSEQNLLDCAGSAYNNNGCSGGWPSSALKYVKTNGGIDSAVSYPTTSDKDGVVGTCKYALTGKAAGIVGYAEIVGEIGLQNQVAIQPVVIAINAAQSLQGYASGVYNDAACGVGTSASLNHAVLVVGYGTDPTAGAYWIVKNSWGTGWGFNGYFLLQKGTGRCGVGQYAVYPTAA